MFKFYYVDEKYIDYLKKFDNRIPNVRYKSNKKFVCGIVLNVNGNKYYAPVSHNTKNSATNFVIKDKSKTISTIRLAYMFPVDEKQLKEIDFSQLKNNDIRYYNLVRKEYAYCVSKLSEIENKAKKIYNLSQNQNHFYSKVCCDFKKLEEAMKSFINDKTKTIDRTDDEKEY